VTGLSVSLPLSARELIRTGAPRSFIENGWKDDFGIGSDYSFTPDIGLHVVSTKHSVLGIGIREPRPR